MLVPPLADFGLTPLAYAVRANDLESVKVLLAAGADINQTTGYGWSPLLVATQNRYYALGKYLLDHGADPNNLSAGLTPLHWAATSWEGFASNPVYGFEDPMSGIPDRQAKLRLVPIEYA